MRFMPTGTLYIISAPSGCGKTSLVAALRRSVANLCVSISHTTRPPRSGEHAAINYHFVSETQFQQLILENAFLEYAEVFGYYYGTTLSWVQQQINAGLDVILEIDWQGARQIKTKFPAAIGIFILPPSWAALQHRLQQRGQDQPSTIQKRMQQAKIEISHHTEYDYLVVNAQFEQAVLDLEVIIHSRRLHIATQTQTLDPLINSLLLENACK